MSGSAGDQRRVAGGILLAAAGVYILFQPFGDSPGTCAGSLSRIARSIGQGISMCVAISALPFVVGSSVGLVSIIAALWMLLPGASGSRTASLLLGVVALAIVVAGIVAVVTSPAGPFRALPPSQTGAPVQTSAPTRGP